MPSVSAQPLFNICPSCGGSTAHPFAVGGVCLRCAGLRALAGEDFALTSPPEDTTENRPGELRRIGAYEIIDEIGRGGMGRVYAARQSALGRIVALKALSDTGNAAGPELRFLREAQTAARLRHPHIVAVHDSGRADGHVFFTMDYVEGGDLAQRLRRGPLAPRAAAAMLHQIAGALAYTHGEGVLHRDLKPSNILLDGDEPRLADFGLAAQLDPGGDLTAVTGVLGTPHYLAPEALRGGSAALTAASDLYAVGVIAYEMLAGRTPFAGASAVELPQLADQRPPPSLRYLAPATPPDLETITLKLLEREPERRYASAAALAEDLRRFLAGEPILAQPPGAWTRFTRYARRHRLAFGIGAAFVTVLLAATIISSSLAIRARRAEQRALAEARTSKALSDFLQNDLLAQATPGEQPNRDVRLRDVLDRAAQKLDHRFPDSPLLEADVRAVVAGVYDTLGEYDAARRQAERAVALREKNLGANHSETISALLGLARILTDQGRHAEAAPLLERALASHRAALGPDHPETLSAANLLALNLRHRARLDEADALLTDTLARARRALPTRDPITIRTLNVLATIRLEQMRHAEAEALLVEALRFQTEANGEDNLDAAATRNDLALVLQQEGRVTDALKLFQFNLALRTRILGSDHPHTFISLGNLGGAYKAAGQLAEAEATQRAALDLGRRVLGPEHPRVLTSTSNLADTLRLRDQCDEAARLLRDLLATRQRLSGADNPQTIRVRQLLAEVLMQQKRFADAESLLRESLPPGGSPAAANAWRTHVSRVLLGQTVFRLGRPSEAEALLLAAYSALHPARETSPAQRRAARDAALTLSELYAVDRRADESATWKKRAEELN